ncbi:MAG: hypothetical protein Q7S81_00070 [bacterium]|nr:hypothetical protein [bacterium]
MIKIIKSNKRILIAGLIVLAVSFIPFDFSHAQGFVAETVGAGFVWFLGKALYMVGYAFSKLTFVGGLILNWALALNANIGDNPAAQIGWGITRDFTNLGFVLLIIIIAFSTILRIGTLQAKQVLPKLIAAALLINFSIIIATFLLDGAGIFTNYFLQKGFLSGESTNGNEVGISQAIAGTLSLGAILGSPAPEFASGLTNWGAGLVNYITSIVFIDIMTAVGAVTTWTMAFMFLVRYVYIGFLLILMPGAILMWVIGNKYWGEWLDKFFKYTFFGPIASFFVYIALSTSTKMEALVSNNLKTLVTADDITGIAAQFADKAASMIMMVFMLMGGLMAAESLSIMGAKTGVATANGAMKFIGKATGKLAAAPFRYGKATADAAAERASKSTNPMLQRWGSRYKASSQRFNEGVIRTKQAIGEIAKFGGESSIGSIYSTALREVGGPLGYKGRHSDEDLKKKKLEALDKNEGRVKLLDLYAKKGISRSVMDKIFTANDKEKDNAKSKTTLDKIERLMTFNKRGTTTKITDTEAHTELVNNFDDFKAAKANLT